MLDRAIGIVGLALTIIFGVVSLGPDSWTKPKPWFSRALIAVGIFLLGYSAHLIAPASQAIETNDATIATGLSLKFSQPIKTPEATEINNINFWYSSYSSILYENAVRSDGIKENIVPYPPR